MKGKYTFSYSCRTEFSTISSSSILLMVSSSLNKSILISVGDNLYIILLLSNTFLSSCLLISLKFSEIDFSTVSNIPSISFFIRAYLLLYSSFSMLTYTCSFAVLSQSSRTFSNSSLSSS